MVNKDMLTLSPWNGEVGGHHRGSALALGMGLRGGSRGNEGEGKSYRWPSCFLGGFKYLLELGSGIKQQVGSWKLERKICGIHRRCG